MGREEILEQLGGASAVKNIRYNERNFAVYDLNYIIVDNEYIIRLWDKGCADRLPTDNEKMTELIPVLKDRAMRRILGFDAGSAEVMNHNERQNVKLMEDCPEYKVVVGQMSGADNYQVQIKDLGIECSIDDAWLPLSEQTRNHPVVRLTVEGLYFGQDYYYLYYGCDLYDRFNASALRGSSSISTSEGRWKCASGILTEVLLKRFTTRMSPTFNLPIDTAEIVHHNLQRGGFMGEGLTELKEQYAKNDGTEERRKVKRAKLKELTISSVIVKLRRYIKSEGLSESYKVFVDKGRVYVKPNDKPDYGFEIREPDINLTDYYMMSLRLYLYCPDKMVKNRRQHRKAGG